MQKRYICVILSYKWYIFIIQTHPQSTGIIEEEEWKIVKIQKSGGTRVKVSSKYDRTQTIALANS